MKEYLDQKPQKGQDGFGSDQKENQFGAEQRASGAGGCAVCGQEGEVCGLS